MTCFSESSQRVEMHCFEIWVVHGAKLLQIWFLEIISGEDLCNCVFTLGYGVSTSSTAVALWHTVYSSWNPNVDQTKALTLLNNTRLRSGKMWTGSLQCQFSIVLQCSSAASALHVLDDLGCTATSDAFPNCIPQQLMSGYTSNVVNAMGFVVERLGGCTNLDGSKTESFCVLFACDNGAQKYSRGGHTKIIQGRDGTDFPKWSTSNCQTEEDSKKIHPQRPQCLDRGPEVPTTAARVLFWKRSTTNRLKDDERFPLDPIGSSGCCLCCHALLTMLT